MDSLAISAAALLLATPAGVAAGMRAAASRARRRFASAAAPLCAEIDGIVSGSAVSGVYAGAPVRARIVCGPDEGGARRHTYELTRDATAGRADWRITHEEPGGWRIDSTDAATAAMLRRGQALAALAQWPSFPDVHYDARRRRLRYREPVAHRLALPAPDVFRDQLELLARIVPVHHPR